MKDYFNLGPVPCEEAAAQLGEADYEIRALEECDRYIDLIKATLGPPPPGAALVTRSFRHDFGTYFEACVEFDDNIPEAWAYALLVEHKAPTRWTP